MGEYEQISLVPDLGGEIEEEDRIRKKEEENLVESLLFSLGRSVSVEEIATCLNMGKDGAFLAAERLRERYEERQEGLLIKKLEDRYQMVSHPLLLFPSELRHRYPRSLPSALKSLPPHPLNGLPP